LEYGTNRIKPSLGLDRNCLRSDENRSLLFQYAWLEHIPRSNAHRKKQEDLRHAHERNDEVLERIYIGRRFKNDTERLEKLFDLYTKMTADNGSASTKAKNGKRA